MVNALWYKPFKKAQYLGISSHKSCNKKVTFRLIPKIRLSQPNPSKQGLRQSIEKGFRNLNNLLPKRFHQNKDCDCVSATLMNSSITSSQSDSIKTRIATLSSSIFHSKSLSPPKAIPSKQGLRPRSSFSRLTYS